MNLWQIITGNSRLPVEPGNNFWDHLNNQSGGGDTFVGPSLSANILSANLAANINNSITTKITSKKLAAKIGNALSATIYNKNLKAKSCQ